MNSTILTWTLLAVLGFLNLAPAVFADKGRARDWFEPIYAASAYFFLIFVLRGAYALTMGTDFLGEPPLEATTIEAMNIAIIYLIPSYLCFLIGYRGRLGTAFASATRRLPGMWNESAFRLSWPLLLAIGISFQIALIQAAGGLQTYLTNKQEVLTAAGQSYFAQGASLIQYVFLLLFSRFCVSGKSGLTSLVIVGSMVMVNGLLSGSKGAFFAPILGMIILFHYLRRNVTLKPIITFAFIVILLFPMFNALRNLGASERLVDVVVSMFESGDSGTLVAILQVMAGQFMARFHDLDSLTYIIRDTPAVMDYQYGATLTPLLYAWIPRFLWEDKPVVSFGKIFGETYYRDFFFGTGTAASPSILGEAYINFHLPGMILIAFAAGVLLRFAYEFLMPRTRTVPGTFVYANLFLYMFVFWESNISGFIADIAVRVTVLLLIAVVLGQVRSDRKPVPQ